MKTLKAIVLDGRIPHFRVIRKGLLFLSLLPIAFYFLSDIGFRPYGEWGWNILIGVMLIRPLADIFPRIGLLRTLVILRKEFGIASGLLIFIHSYAFFAEKGQLIFIEMFKPEHWVLENPKTWGLLGFIIVIILLLTSNNWALRLLRRHWKTVQRLAYPLFFFSAAHIALVNPEELSKVLLPVGLVLLAWVFAQLDIVLLKKKHANE